MIYETGNIQPSISQKRENERLGDDSFGRICSPDFAKGVPRFEGRKIDESTVILLKCKNVEPHRDPYTASADAEPEKRAAFFWLTKGSLNIQCGYESKRMQEGDYIIFDDSKMHCVVADKQWLGAAGQYL